MGSQNRPAWIGASLPTQFERDRVQREPRSRIAPIPEWRLHVWSIPGGTKLSQIALPRQGFDIYPVRSQVPQRGSYARRISRADPRKLMFFDTLSGHHLDRTIENRGGLANPGGRSKRSLAALGRIRRRERSDDSPLGRANPKRIRTGSAERTAGSVARPRPVKWSNCRDSASTPSSEQAVWIVDTARREPPRELCRFADTRGGLAFVSMLKAIDWRRQPRTRFRSIEQTPGNDYTAFQVWATSPALPLIPTALDWPPSVTTGL